MTHHQPLRFITRPYHRSLDQQITAILDAAVKWSAEALPLAEQAQLLLASDRILATEIQNLHDPHAQPPNQGFVLVLDQNRNIVAAFAVLADRSDATADIRHLTVTPPYRDLDIESTLLSPIEQLARQNNYQYIVSSV